MTASRDSGRISSSTPKAPSSWPPATTYRTVFPSDAQALVDISTSAGALVLASANRRGPPTIMLLPSTIARAPRPASAWKLEACKWSTLLRLASPMTALASGCSELASTAAARAINSDSDVPGTATISDIAGDPRVSVPVLSNITMSKLRALSSASLSFTRRPFCAPSDVEMAITSGIASPNA